jgi:hypothetical protein
MATRADDYRYRAEELRTIADGMRDPSAAKIVRDLAENYERFAHIVEERERKATKKD